MLSAAQRYAIAALLAACLALGFGLWYSVSANGSLRAERDTAEEALSQAVETRNREQALLAQRERELALERRKSAQAQQALQKALQAEREWSEGVVPEGVQNALREAL